MVATSGQSWCARLGLVSYLAMGGAIAIFGDGALAQITPDGTLPNNSIVTSQGNTSVISEGTQAGSNLFHSFDQFSVPTGGAAYFNNALNIQNIFSRVTGGKVSNIDGLIRANGTANLFLLNPNGIIFGPNARLNIGGSFLGSTASSINFADGTQFSATAAQTKPLLTVSVPIGLQYGGTTPGGIQVQESGIGVQSGQTLALLGGDVSVEGGKFGFLEALGGRIELGGLTGAGMVEIEGQQSQEAFRLSKLRFPDSVLRADVLLTNFAYVDVAAGGGGSIVINARNIDIADGSVLRGGLETNLGFLGAQAGDIELSVQETINVANGFIANNVRTGAVGNSGNINITGELLSVANGAELQVFTSGQGNAGSININAHNTVSLYGVDSNGVSSAAFSFVEEGAVGNGGDINITTGALSLANNAELFANTREQGNAGSVNINARDTVSLDGGAVFTSVASGAVGKGGSINITAKALSLANGAQLIASTRGQGDAGSVTINARDTVSLKGVDSNGFPSGIATTVESRAVGNGGDIKITAGSLSVTNGAGLSTSIKIKGQGDAGSVNINVRDTVLFDGVDSNGLSSAAFSTVESRAVGNGGDINITAGALSLVNGAQLQANTYGQGDAGSVTINARDIVSLDGVNSNNGYTSAAFSDVEEGAVGNGGDIKITAGSLSATNGAGLSVSTRGQGDAGSVTINARDTVFFDGVDSNGFPSAAFSTVESRAVGNGGDINITTGLLSLANGAKLTASNTGNGTAGNIEVSASSIRLDNEALLSSNTVGGEGNIRLRSPSLILRRGSNITTNATGSNITGGNITIDTDILAAVENSDISANSDQFFGGQVRINAQGIFGTQFRLAPTPESDITATGGRPEFSGTVEINTPDVDPSSGLATLPTVPIETEVVQACQPGGSQQQSEFVVTGRGGLPPSPGDSLSTDAVQVDLITLNPEVAQPSTTAVSPRPTSSTPAPIVEAQGWVINAKGQVVLTAHVPTVTPHSSWQRPAQCHGSSIFHEQPLTLGMH